MDKIFTDQELHDFVIQLYQNKISDKPIADWQIPCPESYTWITKIGYTSINSNPREPGFQYAINNGNSAKYVPFSSLYAAYHTLLKEQKLTRALYLNHYSTELNGRKCNFTTVGGILVLLNIAKYDITNQCYIKIDSPL